jgi:hypothetical protein
MGQQLVQGSAVVKKTVLPNDVNRNFKQVTIVTDK